MEMHRVYLATPYSHPDPEVRTLRFYRVSEYANRLLQKGVVVYSPITHGHTLGSIGSLPGDFEFWREHCLSFLRHWADRVIVLKQPGWTESKGVKAEIAEAVALGLPITFTS